MGLDKGNRLNRLGPVQQKVLLIILGGIGLSLSKTPKQYFRVIKEVSKEWKNINKRTIERAIFSLYKSKLIKERENPDGSLTMVLTEKGEEKIRQLGTENFIVEAAYDGQVFEK